MFQRKMFEDNGDVLGVEILNASKNLINLYTIAGKFVSHYVTEAKSYNLKSKALKNYAYESVSFGVPSKELVATE